MSPGVGEVESECLARTSGDWLRGPGNDEMECPYELVATGEIVTRLGDLSPGVGDILPKPGTANWK